MLAEKNTAEEFGTKMKICHDAFTLVELLIVIVLMAIIIGISAPAFIGMGRGAGMRGGVRAVCSTLSLLRQWAITHRERVTFYYFEGGASSSSYYYAANDAGTVIDKTNELPLEVMFDSVNDGNNTDTITFKTDGGLSVGAGNPLKIIIQDRKPSTPRPTKTITVNGLTGGIHVE